jgi:hypothetical protein
MADVDCERPEFGVEVASLVRERPRRGLAGSRIAFALRPRGCLSHVTEGGGHIPVAPDTAHAHRAEYLLPPFNDPW